MGNQASMVNSMADKLFLPADLVLDGAPTPSSSQQSTPESKGSPQRRHRHTGEGSPDAGGEKDKDKKQGTGGVGRLKRRSPSAGGLNNPGPGSGRLGHSQSASALPYGGNPTSSSSGGMGILAFEVASAMQRALELWEQLDASNVARLRLVLQSEGVVKLVRSENHLPWRLVGMEIQRDLRVLRSIVTSLGKRGADPRLHTLDRRFSALDYTYPQTNGPVPSSPNPGIHTMSSRNSPSPSLIPASASASPLSSSSSSGGISRSSSANSSVNDGTGKGGEEPTGEKGGDAAVKPQEGVLTLACNGSASGADCEEPREEREAQIAPAALAAAVGAAIPECPGSPERVYPQSFLPKEEGFLLKYLEDMLSATTALHLEMSTLDNLLPSSHPLRLSRMLRDLPPRAQGPGQPPLPPAANAPSGYVANSLAQERIAAQTKAVHRLQRESLWSESFDKCTVLLAAAVIILTRKYQSVFSKFAPVAPEELSNTLWAGGLSLHYAHTLLLVDRIVGRPTLVLRAQRDELYQRLPSKVRHALRRRLKGKRRPFDLEAAIEIRHAMQDMLAWMLPLASLTIAWQAEHSYGCHLSRRANSTRTLQVQTLHFADKDQFETLLVELLAGVSYFARPPGFTALQPSEEASWKAWQTCGGDPRNLPNRTAPDGTGLPPAAPGRPAASGGTRGGPHGSGRGTSASVQGQDRQSGGTAVGSSNGVVSHISISTLWGEGIRKDGISQALSAFGAAAKASYASAFFGDRSSVSSSAGPVAAGAKTRPLGTGRKPSPARPRPQQQNLPLMRQASF